MANPALIRLLQGYAPLNSDFDSFYTRRFKVHLDDCFSTPVAVVTGHTIICYDRESSDCNVDLHTTGRCTRGLNISSCNHLGLLRSGAGVVMPSRNLSHDTDSHAVELV